jgi:hypothetical protein
VRYYVIIDDRRGGVCGLAALLRLLYQSRLLKKTVSQTEKNTLRRQSGESPLRLRLVDKNEVEFNPECQKLQSARAYISEGSAVAINHNNVMETAAARNSRSLEGVAVS